MSGWQRIREDTVENASLAGMESPCFGISRGFGRRDGFCSQRVNRGIGMWRLRLVSGALCVVIAFGGISPAITINEIRIDQPSTDNDEYFELSGASGTSLDGLTYLVLGDGSSEDSGVIEAEIGLDAMEIPDDGFFLATESSFGAAGTRFEGIVPDLVGSLNFENSDNVTHVLVSEFSGAVGQDLDIDDDGTLDDMPWDTVLDALGLVESPDLSAAASEHFYGVSLGFSDIGPDGIFAPAHVFRISDGNSNFEIGPFNLDEMSADTPGRSNRVSPADCDFDGDGACDITDIDELVMKIVAGTNDLSFDLTGDNVVDLNDITDPENGWLAQAGEENIGPGRAYLSGDADLSEVVDGPDFLAWNLNKFTSVARWSAGNFNADGMVDGQDFLIWNTFKFQSSDHGPRSVPEPAAGIATLLIAMLWLRRHLVCRSN